MFLLLAILALSDTSIVTDRLCRIDTRGDLHRLYSRGRVVVTDTSVQIRGRNPIRLDGHFGRGGYTLHPSPGSVPLEFLWRLTEDTIYCGQSRIYSRERKKGRNKFSYLANSPFGAERCRVGFGEKTIIFVRFKRHTDIYINHENHTRHH